MPSRTAYVFLCLVLAFTTVTVFRAPAETIDEYKERIRKEQEEKKEKEKKSRSHDEKGGAPDLSGLCGCLGSLFEAMASTDIEVTVEQEPEPEYVNPPPADETPPDDATVTPDDSLPPDDTPPDDAAVTPDDSLPPDDTTQDDGTAIPDDTSPDDAAVTPDDSLPPDESAAADGKAADTPADDTANTAEEPDRVKPIKPFIALSLAASYLFGQEIPFFDGMTRVTMNIEVFHIHAWYQLMADANGSYLSTFSANLGLVLGVDTIVSSVYAGVFVQEGSAPAFSFGTDLKFAFTDNFFLEIYTLFSFDVPLYNIILIPSLNLVVGPLTVGAGCGFYDYSGLVICGPSVTLGLWF